MKRRIAITEGDPAGIGPEIARRAASEPRVLAVCQPAVPAFAATALMNEDKNPYRPRTLTMMGGPIDTREAPTAVNTLATQRPFSWFEQNVIEKVADIHPGRGRRVYPRSHQLETLSAYALRYDAQTNAYFLLVTDVYPHASPLEGEDTPEA